MKNEYLANSPSDLFIFGSGGHCGSVLEVLAELELDKPPIVVLEDSEKLDEFEKLSRIMTLRSIFETDLAAWREEDQGRPLGLIAIGNISKRRKIWSQMTKFQIRPFTLVASTAQVSRSANLRPGTFVGHGSYVGPLAKIGAMSIINTNSTVEHDVNLGDNCHIAPGAVLLGNVSVGSDSFIGAGSVVKESATLGKGSIVGSLSFINENFEEANQTLVGIPGRVMPKPEDIVTAV